MTTSEIKFKVTVDENHLPHKIEWEAPDAHEGSMCKSMMVALWDEKENNTLRIDLWTKDMTVDEMKKFFHQNITTLTDTYLRATNDEATAKELREYMSDLGKRMGVLAND
jgi:gliding motility-associated protein GldC